MNFSPSIQKLAITLVVMSILGFVVYSTLFGEVVIPTNEDGTLAVEVDGKDILILADKLEKVQIKREVFSSPLFTNLVDISTEVLPEDQGRINPFIKVSSGAITTVNSVRRP